MAEKKTKGALVKLYLKKETVEALLKGINGNDKKGVELTLSLKEDTNKYGQNVDSWVSQTQEQEAAKKERFYTGNGKVVWIASEGIVLADKEAKVDATAKAETAKPLADDLPF